MIFKLLSLRNRLLTRQRLYSPDPIAPTGNAYLIAGIEPDKRFRLVPLNYVTWIDSVLAVKPYQRLWAVYRKRAYGLSFTTQPTRLGKD